MQKQQWLRILSRSFAAKSKRTPKAQGLEEILALDLANRRDKITADKVGASVRVHNGKDFIKVTVKEEMVGYKFGEFAATRKRGPDPRVKISMKRRNW